MSAPIKENDCLTGTIIGIAFGGAGILKHDGLVVFIPYTAIGDVVNVRIAKISKNFAHGELVNVIQSSPDRTTPHCPYFGTCGGCQLQHLTYPAQLNHKKGAVEDSLKRIGEVGQLPIENIVPSSLQWAYRRHIRLTLQYEKGHFAAGYISNDHRTFLKVNGCPIFVEEDKVIEEVQDIASKLFSPMSQEGNATLLKEDEGDGYLCVFRFEKQFPTNFEEVIQAAIQKWPFWKGVTGIVAGKIKSFGAATTTMTIGGLVFSYSPNAFIQSHPEQSKAIYEHICSLVHQAKARKVLDLYCGIGITSLLLGKRGVDMMGIEENPEAIKLARLNAEANQIQNVQFIQGDAGKELPKLPFFKASDLLIVNPPRIGLDQKVVDAIGKVRPKKLIYVSCMPPTLARDLKKLSVFGYTISSCKPYDMFPQTAHVETVVELVRA
jgi:23S rRNA (uracil1939-C5)-methyltransferase